MSLERELFARFLEENPFQPATGFWRSIEIAYVAGRGLPDGRGLDIGCGDGRLMALLAEQTGRRELVGVDLDEREVAAARTSGAYALTHVASADAIPEPAASFDFAFSNSTLEHVGPLAGTLAEIARLLRPGGILVFTVPSHEFHAALAGPLVGSREGYLRAIDRRCAHLRYPDPEAWRAHLAGAGLELVEASPYLSAGEVRRWETISRLTAGVLHTLMRRHPIEIQHRLGMRRGQRLPARLARPLARLLAARVAPDAAHHGCTYLVARKPGAAG